MRARDNSSDIEYERFIACARARVTSPARSRETETRDTRWCAHRAHHARCEHAEARLTKGTEGRLAKAIFVCVILAGSPKSPYFSACTRIADEHGRRVGRTHERRASRQSGGQLAHRFCKGNRVFGSSGLFASPAAPGACGAKRSSERVFDNRMPHSWHSCTKVMHDRNVWRARDARGRSALCDDYPARSRCVRSAARTSGAACRGGAPVLIECQVNGCRTTASRVHDFFHPAGRPWSVPTGSDRSARIWSSPSAMW